MGLDGSDCSGSGIDGRDDSERSGQAGRLDLVNIWQPIIRTRVHVSVFALSPWARIRLISTRRPINPVGPNYSDKRNATRRPIRSVVACSAIARAKCAAYFAAIVAGTKFFTVNVARISPFSFCGQENLNPMHRSYRAEAPGRIFHGCGGVRGQIRHTSKEAGHANAAAARGYK